MTLDDSPTRRRFLGSLVGVAGEVGSIVRRGDVLATLGSSGNASNPHLHFEVRPDGTGASAIAPVPLLPFPIAGVTLGERTGCA